MEPDNFSFGVVPVRYTAEGLQMLLGKSARGDHFTIPKGHLDQGEAQVDGAVRELMEESGHAPRLFLTEAFTWTPDKAQAMQLPPLIFDHYSRYLGRQTRKLVGFFVAQVEYVSEVPDTQEIEYIRWFPATAAITQVLRYEVDKEHFCNAILPVLDRIRDLAN